MVCVNEKNILISDEEVKAIDADWSSGVIPFTTQKILKFLQAATVHICMTAKIFRIWICK